MSRLRLAFMGTPDFAVPSLAALLTAGHEMVRVYTQPPRPAGRGQHPQASPVERVAIAHGIEVRTPQTLRDAAEQASFGALDLDAAVVVAYGLLLPPAILGAPRLGCLNVHASLLPRWRGAAPIQRAILAGDAETGITIMKMDEGLDTGPMLCREGIPIAPDMDAGTMHDALAALGAKLLVAALDGLAAGRIVTTPQPSDGVTYAAKIAKTETRLDWRASAETLARQVRAFSPAPGAWFTLFGERIRVLAAARGSVAKAGLPGVTLDDRLTVACGEGALQLLRVQRAGGRPLDADTFLRGRPVPAGTVLG